MSSMNTGRDRAPAWRGNESLEPRGLLSVDLGAGQGALGASAIVAAQDGGSVGTQSFTTLTAVDFLPMDIGPVWNYSGAAQGFAASATLTNAALEMIGEVQTTRLQRILMPAVGSNATINDNITNDSSGITLYASSGSDSGGSFTETFDTPVVLVPATMTVGEVHNYSGTYAGTYTVNSSDEAFTGEITSGSTELIGFTTLNTPVGNFEAAHLRLITNYTEISASRTITGTRTENWYLMYGLGLVKFSLADNGSSTADGAFSESASMDVSSTTLTRVPDVTVTGGPNVMEIADGDATPNADDDTDYGTVNNGDAAESHTFTVTNTGNALLSLGSATAPTGYTITSNLPTSLNPGKSADLVVELDTTTDGTKAGDVSFTTNVTGENQFNYAVTGEVTSTMPDLDIRGPGSVAIADGDTTPTTADGTDFGSVAVGESTSIVYTFANTGDAPLTLTGDPRLEIVGAHASDFAVTSFQPPAIFGPSTQVNITVTFTPSAATQRYAAIVVRSDDPDEDPYNFAIRGTGLPNAEIDVSFEGTPIADGDVSPTTGEGTLFATTAVGETSTRTFTIENTGTTSLSVGTVNVAGAHAADFTVTDQPDATVAGGGSTTFTVEFAPSAANTRYAAITFINGDTDESPYNFAIRGVGAQNAEIAVSANGNGITDGSTNVSTSNGTFFDDVPVGMTVSETFTIENTGSGTLSLDGSPRVRVVGSDAAAFVVTAQPAATVDGGISTTFTVEFTPTKNGIHYGALVIDNNDADEDPFNFAIRGEGIPSVEIALSGNGNAIADNSTTPSASNGTYIGPVAVGSSTTQVFTIDNTGGGTLSLTGTPLVEVLGADASDFTVTVDPASSIAGGGNTTFTVQFAPSKTGLHFAALRIFNGDSDENPYNFAIRGEGSPPVEIAVTGNANDVPDNGTTVSATNGTYFGDVEVGMNASQVFTIENSGSGTLSLTGTPLVEVVGADAAAFTVTVDPASSIAGVGSTNFTVQFDPTKSGIHYAALRIANNDSDENPFNFAIRGNGTAAMMSSAMLAAFAESQNDASDSQERGDTSTQADAVEVVASVNDDAFAWLGDQLA